MRRTGHVGTFATAPRRPHWLETALIETNTFLEQLVVESRPAPVWSRSGTSVEVTALAGADLFVNPSVPPARRPSSGRVVAPVSGDFLFSARVAVDFSAAFDAGSLYVEYDDHRWFKLCLESSWAQQPTILSVVTRETSDDSSFVTIDGNSTYLRVARRAEGFAMHASGDGRHWELVRHFSIGVPSDAPVKVGFLAQSPDGSGCHARFDHISLTRATLTNIKDGS